MLISRTRDRRGHGHTDVVKLEQLDAYAPAAEDIWRTLEGRAAASYFVSWAWIENWLACIPRDLHARMFVLRDDRGGPVAAMCGVRRVENRLPMLPSRAVHVHATGSERFDNVWIEHNGSVGKELPLGCWIDAMEDDWDEMFLPGLRHDAFCGVHEAVIRGFRVKVERAVPSFVVELELVRDAGYLQLVSAQTRAQIRRARREAGAIELELARDERHALELYGELVALHQQHWSERGQPGAWADPWFDCFHRRLIAKRFSHGEIELVRVRSERGTLGILYNFASGDRVLQYQSGIAKFDDPRLKAGYLTHAAAIEHAARGGRAIYDFLAGDVRYKRSLATSHRIQSWVRVQRPRMRFLLEDRLRDLARWRWIERVRSVVSAPTVGG